MSSTCARIVVSRKHKEGSAPGPMAIFNSDEDNSRQSTARQIAEMTVFRAMKEKRNVSQPTEASYQ
ncbi:hypothetical protein BOTNAR_0015g00060 [Botryotinia narcissicola]|uniref:Uncharacterized protein n=1 Tax=Botryotinia narcissicola TaxID=278944 RepID=A0A4Z1J798_9HELO|nr:hypothetical protein BOTNAR_0015g00060 [Botryotinia narcissicola]